MVFTRTEAYLQSEARGKIPSATDTALLFACSLRRLLKLGGVPHKTLTYDHNETS